MVLLHLFEFQILLKRNLLRFLEQPNPLFEIRLSFGDDFSYFLLASPDFLQLGFSIVTVLYFAKIVLLDLVEDVQQVLRTERNGYACLRFRFRYFMVAFS